MSKPWPKGRREPYTVLGISRLSCIRCGDRAEHSWQICADGNKHRPLCLKCDVELNELVLNWAGDPRARKKIQAYRAKVYG